MIFCFKNRYICGITRKSSFFLCKIEFLVSFILAFLVKYSQWRFIHQVKAFKIKTSFYLEIFVGKKSSIHIFHILSKFPHDGRHRKLLRTFLEIPFQHLRMAFCLSRRQEQRITWPIYFLIFTTLFSIQHF